jgi:hypothetical protein
MLAAKAAVMEQVVSTVAPLVVSTAQTLAVAVAALIFEKSLATSHRESQWRVAVVVPVDTRVVAKVVRLGLQTHPIL